VTTALRWTALAIASAITAHASAADACCTVRREGASVAIADQQVLIVWDEARQEEHFIRQATFQPGAEKSFGFLVPTPTKPTVAEADGRVFERLAEATKPVPQTVYRPDLTPLLLAGFMRFGGAVQDKMQAAAASVRVVERQSVAGYDVAVLEADEPRALAQWLADNGYDARPEIAEWARPYIADRWKITAFKYAQPEEDSAAPAVAGTVRLSFHTPRPLFPYRVPSDQVAAPGEGHLLRVFFAGATRVDGAFAADDPWWGRVQFAAPVAALPQLIEGATPSSNGLGSGWLTVFEDRSWPGGQKDVYFGKAASAEAVVPTYPVPRRIHIPADLLALAGFGGWSLIKRRRRATGPLPP
jgi:hypothetical protein